MDLDFDFFGSQMSEIGASAVKTIGTSTPVTPTATKTETSQDDGFFSFLDSAGETASGWLGGLVDLVEDSKIGDSLITDYFSTPEKTTDQTPVQPESGLSGAIQTVSSVPTPYLIGGGVVALFALVVLIKKL